MGGGVLSYEDMLYQRMSRGQFEGMLRGFTLTKAGWCGKLKMAAINRAKQVRICEQVESILHGGTQENPSQESFLQAIGRRAVNIVQYLGIAADEPERIERHEKKQGIMLPLVMVGWDEAYCRKWCEERDLLSPIYTTATRGGCWFCHNQGVGQLRLLRKNYPDLWALLMKWDLDSPTTFKADGHTVHDYDKRFELEDKGVIHKDDTFKWAFLDNAPNRQIRLDELF